MHYLGCCHWSRYMVGGQSWPQDSTHREYEQTYIFFYIAITYQSPNETGNNSRYPLLEWLLASCLLRLLSLLRQFRNKFDILYYIKEKDEDTKSTWLFLPLFVDYLILQQLDTFQGFVAKDSSIFNILGILSVVGVVVCFLIHKKITDNTCAQESSCLCLINICFSVDDHFLFAWNGTHPMADNVRGS